MSAKATQADRSRRVAALAYDYRAHVTEDVVECNLCGGDAFVETAGRDRYGYPVTYQVCAACGLGFLSPRLTAAEYADFYARIYRPLVSAYHGRRIDAETVQAEQRTYADELVEFLGTALPAPPRTVLDVGGSTGVVADAVRDAFGARATVLDPSPDELARAAAAGMETVAGFAEDADLRGRTFDLVLLCQTIDHLLDVAATLRSVRGWIASGGHAFVDVLDVDLMLRRRGSIEEAVKVDHPFYLTKATALGYFALIGLAPVAERLLDDGHWGFVLAPTDPAEPDWAALRAGAETHLAAVHSLREERVGVRALAVVPARGGSRRVPRKNLAELGGKSLVRRALETALAAGCFDTVALSTEDVEIAAEAAGLDVIVLDRPPELATDDALAVDVVRHALETLESDGRFDVVAVVQATSPFTSPADVAGAVAMLVQTGTASVVSVVKVEAGLHPLKLKLLEGDRLLPYVAEDGLAPSQLLPELWMRNGSVYVSRRDVLDGDRLIDERDVHAFVMPAERSLDIDTPRDLAFARFLLTQAPRKT